MPQKQCKVEKLVEARSCPYPPDDKTQFDSPLDGRVFVSCARFRLVRWRTLPHPVAYGVAISLNFIFRFPAHSTTRTNHGRTAVEVTPCTSYQPVSSDGKQ